MASCSFGCSKDDSSEMAIVPTESSDGVYFHLKVNGTEIPFIYGGQYNLVNRGGVSVDGDLIAVNIEYGFNIYNSLGLNRLGIKFFTNGKFLKAEQESIAVGINNFGIQYKNFYNFPANYFHVNIISIDEINNRIKATFQGKLYANQFNLDSESIDIEGDFDIIHKGSVSTPNYKIEAYGVEQYCKAKINGALWTALWESPNGTFTSEDPYKIDIQFPQVATTGSYNLDSNSTNNYLKFSKYNTLTRVFDDYETKGVVSFSYREFHGASKYSFIGTFSFTAVNRNNPLDIVQVSEGTYRSYKIY